MINLFVDTEITILNIRALKPISIAFVDDTGQRVFYAEFADTYRAEDCDHFVIENVLPYLRHGEYEMNMIDVRCKLYEYFESFNDDIKIWSDASEWDETVMRDIFPPHYENELPVWPPSVYHKFGKLHYWGTDAVKFSNIQKELFSSKKSSLRDKYVGRQLYQHNALDDATANYIGWLKVGKKFQSEEKTP